MMGIFVAGKDMQVITTTHWCLVVGMGCFTFLMLFLAAEGLIKGKLSAPSVVLAGFLIAIAAISMSFFLACVGDIQQGRLDTFEDIERGWKHVTWFVRYL